MVPANRYPRSVPSSHCRRRTCSTSDPDSLPDRRNAARPRLLRSSARSSMAPDSHCNSTPRYSSRISAVPHATNPAPAAAAPPASGAARQAATKTSATTTMDGRCSDIRRSTAARDSHSTGTTGSSTISCNEECRWCRSYNRDRCSRRRIREDYSRN